VSKAEHLAYSLCDGAEDDPSERGGVERKDKVGDADWADFAKDGVEGVAGVANVEERSR